MDLFSTLQLLHEAVMSVLVTTIYGRWRGTITIDLTQILPINIKRRWCLQKKGAFVVEYMFCVMDSNNVVYAIIHVPGND